ncbi:hypothetical protein [Caballeronia sp. KNU42]
MGTSDLAFLPAFSAQLIAGASTFDKPSIDDKKTKAPPPSRLKVVSAFDMAAKGAWQARRDLYRSLCRTPTGRISFAAAELYQDILDLWQQTQRVQNLRNSDNSYYWGRPIAKWAKKYGVTEDQFDGWLKILRDRKLIATCTMKTPYNMLQIRPLVAEGSACLSGWPDSHNYAHLLKAETQAQQGPAGSFGPAAQAAKQPCGSSAKTALIKDLGLPVGVACTSLLDSVAASPATKADMINSSGETGKDNPKVKSKTASPESVLETPKIDKTPLKNGKQPLSFAREWEQLMRERGKYMPLNRTDCRKLKDARNKLYAAGEEKGFTPSTLLRSALVPWFKFAMHARDESQCGWLKHEPDVTFFITHLSSVVTWHEKQLADAAEKVALAAQMLKAHADIAAFKAAHEAAPVDNRLSVADAWEQVERASAMIPHIGVWRGRVAAGIPTPALNEYLAGPAFTAEKLEIALLLMPPADPKPKPEPEPPPVTCLTISQEGEAASGVLWADDYGYDEPPQSHEAQLAALAAWLPQAMARKAAADAEAAKKAAGVKLTASA